MLWRAKDTAHGIGLFHPLSEKASYRMTILSTPLRAVAGTILATAVLAGCATNPIGAPVSGNSVQRAQTVEFGVVTAARPVAIQANSTALGTTTGAVVGGAIGSNLGSGSFANTAGAVGGAVAGGMAGNAIQSNAGARQGVEVTVNMDNGRTIVVVQEGSPDAFRPGDRVRVTSDGQTTRVSR